jgi:hypothetical protein
MPNRFYVPTPTQYTSQFVEKQYPFGEMLALEEKKTQRAENITTGVGELESLLGPLTIPGIFTQEESQKIKPILQQKIIDYTERHIDDMSSLNAMRDFTKLRGEIISDPVVQAIQYDRENLTPQYNQVRLNRKSNLDIDPNLQDPNNPELGVNQWHPGQAYPVIQPLQGYVDWQKPIQNLFNQMTPNKVSNVVNEKTKDGLPYVAIRTNETLTDVDFEKVAKGIVTDMTKGNIQGDTEAADSYKRNFKLRYGREPDFEKDYDIILKDVMDQSPAFRVNRSDLSNVNWGTTTEETPPKPGELGGGEYTDAIRRGINYTSSGAFRKGANNTIKADVTSGIDIHSILKNITSPGQTGSKETRGGTELPKSELRSDFDEDNKQQIAEAIYLNPGLFDKYKSQIKPEVTIDSAGVEVIDPTAVKNNKFVMAKANEEYLNDIVSQTIHIPAIPLAPDNTKMLNDLLVGNISTSVDSKSNKSLVTFEETGFNEPGEYYIEWGKGISDRKNSGELKKDHDYKGIVFKGTTGNENPWWPQALIGNMYIGRGPKKEIGSQVIRFNPSWVVSPEAPGDLFEWTGWNYQNEVNPRQIYPLDPKDFVKLDAQGLRNKSIDEQYGYLKNNQIPFVYMTFDPTKTDYKYEDGTIEKLPRYYVMAYGYNDKGEEVPITGVEGITRKDAWNNFSRIAGGVE